MNRYGGFGDPYCYPGTDVLRNKFDLRDPAKLADAERRIGYSKVLEEPPKGRFGRAHLMATIASSSAIFMNGQASRER